MARRQEHSTRQAPTRLPPAAPVRPAPQRANTSAAKRRWSEVTSAIVWGGGGFVVGAVFWHVIGFWSFMSAVVLGDADSRRNAVDGQRGWSTQVIGPPSHLRATARRSTPSSCTVLAIDRPTGLTTAKPCPTVPPPVVAQDTQKADRLLLEAIPDSVEATAVIASQSADESPTTIETSAVKPRPAQQQ